MNVLGHMEYVHKGYKNIGLIIGSKALFMPIHKGLGPIQRVNLTDSSSSTAEEVPEKRTMSVILRN